MSERLYILDFRSSCPDWRVLMILRLTYTLQYEDLNYSQKMSQVWDCHQDIIPIGLTLALRVSFSGQIWMNIYAALVKIHEFSMAAQVRGKEHIVFYIS